MRPRIRWIIPVCVSAALVALAIIVIVLRRGDEQTAATGEDLNEKLDLLRSVPYTSLTAERVDKGRAGVVAHNSDRSFHGYNVYCSRITPEVLLMDMGGDIVHRWSYPTEIGDLWDHATMLDNGDVVVIVKFKHLLRLDWNSNLLWKRDIWTHHDITQAPDGTFYVIELGVDDHRGFVVRFPSIVHLDSEGEEIERWSSYDNLDHIKETLDQTSFLDTILDSMLTRESWLEVYEKITRRIEAIKIENMKIQYDHFHLNTISILPDTPLGRRDRRFRAGNLLICFRNVNQIAVLDKDTKEIHWAWGEGILEWPHHPTMLDNGNILVFDNGSRRKYSRVIELDPVGKAIEWEYVDDPPRNFYTYGKGSSQRLPNGNTLICEGDKGRAFEVTESGEIVWEWFNPMTKDGRRVQLYRMIRLPPEVVAPLLALGSEPMN